MHAQLSKQRQSCESRNSIWLLKTTLSTMTKPEDKTVACLKEVNWKYLRTSDSFFNPSYSSLMLYLCKVKSTVHYSNHSSCEFWGICSCIKVISNCYSLLYSLWFKLKLGRRPYPSLVRLRSRAPPAGWSRWAWRCFQTWDRQHLWLSPGPLWSLWGGGDGSQSQS